MTTIAGDEADDDPRTAHTRLVHGSSSPSENWDDDFEFQAGAVAHASDDRHDAMNAPSHPGHSHEQEESWDDAYEDDNTHASPVKRAPKVVDEDVEDWDSSDNELESHDVLNHDIRHDNTREFGSGGFEEEDKTVTARSTSSRPRDPRPALLLPIPPALHFQAHTVLPPSTTSPTLSSFSIPLSSTTRDRASIYSQEPLVPGSTNSAPHLTTMRSYPQAAGSTPPRKSRRLRKKSRPPEADIFELEDREPDLIPTLVPVPAIDPSLDVPSPTTPPNKPLLESPTRAPQPSAPPTPSPSLLTRIGSFKRWGRRSVGPDDLAASGWRRARSSTAPSESKSSYGPNDVIFRGGKSSTGPDGLACTDEGIEGEGRNVSPTPVPGSSTARRSRGSSASGLKAGWFFRAGGAAGAEREEVTPTTRTPELSPVKRTTTLGLRKKTEEAAEAGERAEGGKTPTPRKPKGKLVPALKPGGPSASRHQIKQTNATRSKSPMSQRDNLPQSHSGPRPMSLLLFPRKGGASVGRNAGVPLSVSVSAGGALSSTGQQYDRDEGDKLHDEVREKEGGMRSLINGVRRISLVGAGQAHKRTKSTSGDEALGGDRKVAGLLYERPRSRAEQNPGSKMKAIPLYAQPDGLNGNGNGLLPPVELNSPATGVFALRSSLPWADYEHDISAMDVSKSHRSPSSDRLSPQQRNHNRQSFSTSTSSLLAGSPRRSSRSRSPVAHAPVPSVSTDFGRGASRGSIEQRTTPQPPASAPLPVPSQPHPQAAVSPAAQSTSLGRATASSPPRPVGLRRNSLGDLKTPLTTGEHKPQLPTLGELKIPARISRAQQGLRRDLGMVKEFAACVEQLKRLQAMYTELLNDLRAAYEASPISPVPNAAQVQFHLPSRPPSQAGTTRKTLTTNSNTSMQSIHQTMSLNSPTHLHTSRSLPRASPDVNGEVARLEHEYGIWWECAELLVELGGGSNAAAGATSNPNLPNNSSTATTPSEEHNKDLGAQEEQSLFLKLSNHVSSMSEPGSLFEQALPTSSNSKGPPQASPPHPTQWRASTGRHDLSARQLRLLKDMLNTPDPASLAYAAGPYSYGVGYPQPHAGSYPVEDVQPWAPWNPSAVTLPSEESSADAHGHVHVHAYGVSPASVGRSETKGKKRRANKLGMLGLREILRGLKRNAIAEDRLAAGDDATPTQMQQDSESSMGSSADDDHYNRRHSPWHQHDEHHVAKLSTGPEAITAIDIPPARTLPSKSPRRPSLASIFRLGQKSTKIGNKTREAVSNGNELSPIDTPRDVEDLTPEYADWDRMSRSDLDLPAAGLGSGMATVRGRKGTKIPDHHSNTSLNNPYPHHNDLVTSKKAPTSSQTSLWDSSPPSATPPHASRLPLSIAEEDGGLHTHTAKAPLSARPTKERTSSWSQARPSSRLVSQSGKAVISGTVRSAPPADLSSRPDPKLALTPETIKPLLEYAKEVSLRLTDCIGEVQTLLSGKPKIS